MTQIRYRNRAGIGLIEVIACTALVAMMIIPIAAVIRASARSIARAEGSTSVEAELRRGLRWISDTVHDGDVITVRRRQLQLRLHSGDIARIAVQGGSLVLDDGTTPVVLVQDVRDVNFSERRQSAPPGARVGLSIMLRARDPATRAWVTVNSTVAIPPQIS